MRKSLLRLALVAFALACGCGSASGQVSHSGVVGRVLAGPTCPVERVPPDTGCAPRPLAARLRITRTGGSASGRVVRSGSDGRFRVELGPGRYTITPLRRAGSPFPRPGPPQTVTVRPGHYSRVTVTYDTGIR